MTRLRWPWARRRDLVEGFEWRTGQTARDREIGVETGCTGSPLCAAALHIRRTSSSDPKRAPQWEEIHLTDAEVAWIIGVLTTARAHHRRRA